MNDIILAPSLLAADFTKLGEAVRAAEEAGADVLHCDIMDGHFVPNISFGPMVVKAVRSVTSLPLYVHLMIEQPERYVEDFQKAGATSITVHAETCPHLHRTIQQIKDLGLLAGVALNPSTPLCEIEHVIALMDSLLVMTVNPGFGGQSFIESMIPKIAEARRMAEDAGTALDISVDGGIDVGTAPKVVRAGANILVAGSAVFSSDLTVKEACTAIRDAARSAMTTRYA